MVRGTGRGRRSEGFIRTKNYSFSSNSTLIKENVTDRKSGTNEKPTYYPSIGVRLIVPPDHLPSLCMNEPFSRKVRVLLDGFDLRRVFTSPVSKNVKVKLYGEKIKSTDFIIY